jgi:hypothetical protein
VKTGLELPVGHSFQARVKNDAEQNVLLRVNRPTQVFVKGEVHPFEAPLNVAKPTGL